MWPIKEIENKQLLLSAQILFPIVVSCRNESLRFSYYHQPLWSKFLQLFKVVHVVVWPRDGFQKVVLKC